MMPRKEKTEITFKKPSFLLGLKFLSAINLSSFVNNLFLSLDFIFCKSTIELSPFTLNSNLLSDDFDPIII